MSSMAQRGNIRERESTADAIAKACAIVNKHAHVAMDSSTDVTQLYRILLDVARGLALVNRNRVSELLSPTMGETCSVDDLPAEEKENLKATFQFGVEVASRMVATRRDPPDFDIFISYPGTEKSLYVKLLDKMLCARAPRHHYTFIAHESLSEAIHGTEADSKLEIFSTLIRSRFVIVVLTLEAVQRPWMMAELMLTYALSKSSTEGRKPLILDAFPGSTWVSAYDGKTFNRRPEAWVDDITKLIPMEKEPQFQIYREEDVFQHIETLVQKVIPGSSTSLSTNTSLFTQQTTPTSGTSISEQESPSGAHVEDDSFSFSQLSVSEVPEYASDDANIVYEAVKTGSKHINKTNIDALLESKTPGYFSVRPSFSNRQRVVFAVKREYDELDYVQWSFNPQTGRIIYWDETREKYVKTLAQFLFMIGAFYYVNHDEQISRVSTILNRAAKEAVGKKEKASRMKRDEGSLGS